MARHDNDDRPPVGTQVVAMTELLAERRADLVRFFTLRLGAMKAADQIVGAIHAAILDGRLHPTGGDMVAAFYRFGSRLVADQLRAERTRSSARQQEVAGLVVAADGAGELAKVAEDRCTQIIAALRALPEATLQIFCLHKFEGQNIATIAATSKASTGEVDRRLGETWILLLNRVRAR